MLAQRLGLDEDEIVRRAAGGTEQQRALIKLLVEYQTRLRPEQRAPSGDDWSTWLLMAGRGFGKSFAGAYDAVVSCATTPGLRYAVVGATHMDVRRTILEGASGIISVCPPALLEGGKVERGYNKSLLEVRFSNGALIQGFTAEQPARLRGPNFHRALCDELAIWSRGGREVFDMLQFTLRLGKNPRTIITTTPRPTLLLKEIVAAENKGTAITRGSTFDNAQNLSPAALKKLREAYEGRALGRQELHGEMVETIEGALWNYEMIQYWPSDADQPDLAELVVAVDPSGTSKGDEAGIVAAGRSEDGRLFVGSDRSMKGGPAEWARAAIRLYDDLCADRIIAEVNFGADMVISLMKNTAREMYRTGERSSDHVAVVGVHASRGKVLRAEPVSALYASPGRVFHVGRHPQLEAEMCSFRSDWDRQRDGSPGRVDALVFALTALSEKMKSNRPMVFGRI